jgi:hypothetical protein
MRLAIRLLGAGIGLIVLGAGMTSSGTYNPEDNMTRPMVSILVAGALSTLMLPIVSAGLSIAMIVEQRKRPHVEREPAATRARLPRYAVYRAQSLKVVKQPRRAPGSTSATRPSWEPSRDRTSIFHAAPPTTFRRTQTSSGSLSSW